MGNFRVKDIKFGRPVATKDRFPTETDATDGKILAWSHRHHKWENHFIEAIIAWPLAYPYWRKVQS